jgi:enamine deaminase RidA (YjgF/YER057c/UK114 family)
VTAAERLAQLGLELPQGLGSRGAYVPGTVEGSLLFVSGHTGRTAAGPAVAGVVGRDVDVETARTSARQAALNLLAAAESVVGLERVVSLLQLRGYVRAAGDFTEHPRVIDAASELLSQVFGGAGHARAAIGVASLPGGAAVEVEAVFGLDPGAAA